ncbi:chemotaxis protein CheW [Alkaliphilus serpentinus]|uniref:Chemotaxis protein CheW n=1 Tax=Alkaliphilus serpentinus TaxID=1482731 RepID=A0A833HPX4_9FIRM|nr:chemotaxis protein CheW [Alkaliphilus serpentinus]KAB3531361.1 purine-binding chemotaxis protein CheW [Alkaliphilus serpentinus]
MNANVENNKQYVIFKLEDEFYGVPITFVETIEKVTEITRVPNSPHYVKGVINLRGEVVPVIDLRRRFQFQDKELTEESRIIVLALEDINVGFLVEGSSEVLTIEPDDIDKTTNFVNSFDDDYISGIGKVKDRMIIIVNIYKILGIEAN